MSGGDYLQKVAQKESGNNYKAVNPMGGASGKYQFVRSTWEGLGYDWKDRFDPALQEEAMQKYSSQTRNAFSQAFKKEPTDADMYGMHFLGAGTYIKLLNNPDNTPITNIVGKKAYEYNKGVMSKNGQPITTGDLKNWLSNKMSGTTTSKGTPTETQLPEYVNFADVGELPSSQGIVFGEEETEEKKPEGVKAADKLNELSFVEELKNLYESEPIQEQQQQVYAEALPTVQVTPLEYTPIQLQKGGEIMVSSNGVFDSGFNPVIVPSNNISMSGVPFNIEAISMETGERKILKPEENFTFKNTKNVLEIPQFKK